MIKSDSEISYWTVEQQVQKRLNMELYLGSRAAFQVDDINVIMRKTNFKDGDIVGTIAGVEIIKPYVADLEYAL